MSTLTTPEFAGISEQNDAFLALFPHRFDYIYATHAAPGETPNWQTESRYPLNDRVIQQGSYLYGVRFGAQTNYCLLDIDASSFYHPQHDPLAIARMMSALEPVGFVSYLACTSSYSGGLHLYIPFQMPHSAWELASAVVNSLENAGFIVKPGQLEVFPNLKPYRMEEAPSLFNAHRLPMQAGSYLLDAEFQPVWSTQQTFVQQWQSVQARNQIDVQHLKRVLKQSKRRSQQISGKADKFIHDLNAEIERGWTDFGQTNRLLGRITLRTYIFQHVLQGGEPLTGQALIDAIVVIARSLPGYHEYCQHQHELEHRVAEWVACIERSRYFPYGTAQGKYQSVANQSVINQSVSEPTIAQEPSWNQRQSDSARDRIRAAIADLLNQNCLPATATARFQALTKYGIGGGSLYRHRDLWHPAHLAESVLAESVSTKPEQRKPVENSPHPPTSLEECSMDGKAASIEHYPPSLLPGDGSNVLPAQALRSIAPSPLLPAGRNSNVSVNLDSAAPLFESCQIESCQIESCQIDCLCPRNLPGWTDFRSGSFQAWGELEVVQTSDSIASPPDPQFVQSVLSELQTQQTARSARVASAQVERSRQQQAAAQARQEARMQQFLASGDPILVAEAIAWAQRQPAMPPDGLLG